MDFVGRFAINTYIHIFLETVHMFPLQVSGACVHQSTLSVCVLSVEQDGKHHVVGRVLFPLEGELGQAGRVLWKDLETKDDTQVPVQAEDVFMCTKLFIQAHNHSVIARLTVFRAGRCADIAQLQPVSAAPLCGGFESSRTAAAHRHR